MSVALSEGKPNNAIFQFEGYATAKGAKRNGNQKILVTAYCSGAIPSGLYESGVTELYLRRRSQAALRSNIRYPHPAFESALKSTYGLVLFQEQVLQIMRSLGLDFGGINTFFKIVMILGRGQRPATRTWAAEVKKILERHLYKNGITDIEGLGGTLRATLNTVSTKPTRPAMVFVRTGARTSRRITRSSS